MVYIQQKEVSMKPKDLPCICIRLRRSSQALTALYNQALEANGLTISQYQLMEKITKNGKMA